MKKLIALLTVVLCTFAASPIFAGEEPTIYVIQKGDTLWGLSERFFNDPYYWPDLWAKNPDIGNPHLVYPGQKIKVFSDHIEIENSGAVPKSSPSTLAASPEKKTVDKTVQEKPFPVNGGEGFISENGVGFVGSVVATYQGRVMVGEGDAIYTDIGSANGARPGDRYFIYKKMEEVHHPLDNSIVGVRIDRRGTLRLTEVTQTGSKGIITHTFREVESGDILMPYVEQRREVPLRAADRNLEGVIVATQTGNQAVGEGDVVYLDFGSAQGLKQGNLLYAVQDIHPDMRELRGRVELPRQVKGALVVVSVGKNTATALVVKSAETVYKGDRVVLIRTR